MRSLAWLLYLVEESLEKNMSNQKEGVKRIALLLESDMAFDRAIARGVGEYIRNQSDWIILMDPMTKPTMESLHHWNPDGIITSIHIPQIDAIAQLKNIPTIGFGSYSKKLSGHLKFPIVTSDQKAIGALAAQHFMNNGLREFAFCGGDETAHWCQQRCEGFTEALSKNDFKCHIFKSKQRGHTNMPDAIQELGEWLKQLPQNCGVFVFFDGWARWVLDACVMHGIKVPQELCVLGVDNDRWLCELSQPKLSSINVNARNAGYTTARLLDQLLNSTTSPDAVTYITPDTIVSRESSNYTLFDDPEVSFALRYIKEHACDPISPTDVLNITGMSNSTGYRKFKKAIGRSIHNEIQRVQMERIKELLTTTNLSIKNIAGISGFENVRYLTQVFRDQTKQTPTEFRRTQSSPELSR